MWLETRGVTGVSFGFLRPRGVCGWQGWGGTTVNAQLPIQSARLLKPQSPRMKV